MPRGSQIVTAREDLLRAAGELLQAGGPAAVTVRATTARAGVATGLLYKHFSGRDDLLIALVVSRFGSQVAEGRALLGRVGAGTVTQNLIEFGLTATNDGALSLARLMASRPDLSERARAALEVTASPGLEHVIAELATYLAAEQEVGRISDQISASIAAGLLVNGWHWIIFRSDDAPVDVAGPIEAVVTALMHGLIALAPSGSTIREFDDERVEKGNAP